MDSHMEDCKNQIQKSSRSALRPHGTVHPRHSGRRAGHAGLPFRIEEGGGGRLTPGHAHNPSHEHAASAQTLRGAALGIDPADGAFFQIPILSNDDTRLKSIAFSRWHRVSSAFPVDPEEEKTATGNSNFFIIHFLSAQKKGVS